MGSLRRGLRARDPEGPIHVAKKEGRDNAEAKGSEKFKEEVENPVGQIRLSRVV
jgi:hypothetical protein